MLNVFRSRRTRLFVPVLATLALAVVPAATGQEQVINPAKAPSAPETIQLEELWRVGGYDDEVLFGVITDIIADDDGNFYLLDAQLSEVQVYSPDGEYLRTIGREGEGPGEFRTAFNLLLLPSGDIGVLQAFPSKIISLTPDGEPADDFELPEQNGAGGFRVLFQASNAGENLAIVYGLNQPSEAGFTQKSVLSLFDQDGQNERRLHDQDSKLNAAEPLIAETEWDSFRNRWTSGTDGKVYSAIHFGEYRISVWNADGELTHEIRRDYPTHKRSDEESQRILDIYKGFMRQIPIPNMQFEIEADWNPIQQLHARDDGTLWVQTSRGAWGLDEGQVAGFDVFDKKGKLVRQVVLEGQGNPQQDGYFVVKDRLFVVTDWLNALMALQGGGADAEVTGDAEPMEIICYKLD